MTRHLRRWAAALLLAGAGAAQAVVLDNALLRLELPEGFVGPASMAMGGAAGTAAYQRPHAADERSTLLQVTRFDFGAALPPAPREALGPLAEHYLQQFIQGVARRREAFTSTAPEPIQLGGLPAARLTWRGMAEGRAMHGTMYCVLAGSVVIVLHTQDFDDAPPEPSQAAEQAIEALKLKGL